MNSRRGSTRSRRLPLGVDRTGLPADTMQRPHLARPQRFDFLGERGHGQFAAIFLQPTHTTAPAVESDGQADPLRQHLDVDGRRREHHAAGFVEPPAHKVERIEQP